MGALSMSHYTISSILSNYYYILSLFFLFLQAMVWQFALKKYKLNHAYMFTSLYYPLLLLSSYFVFQEEITVGNIIGTAVIISGLVFPLLKTKVQ